MRKETGDVRYQCKSDAERASLAILVKVSLTRPLCKAPPPLIGMTNEVKRARSACDRGYCLLLLCELRRLNQFQNSADLVLTALGRCDDGVQTVQTAN